MNFVKTYRKQVLIIGLSLLIIIVGFYFIFERVKNKKEVKEMIIRLSNALQKLQGIDNEKYL